MRRFYISFSLYCLLCSFLVEFTTIFLFVRWSRASPLNEEVDVFSRGIYSKRRKKLDRKGYKSWDCLPFLSYHYFFPFFLCYTLPFLSTYIPKNIGFTTYICPCYLLYSICKTIRQSVYSLHCKVASTYGNLLPFVCVYVTLKSFIQIREELYTSNNTQSWKKRVRWNHIQYTFLV